MKFWEKRIYADAAASTPVSLRVQKEMRRLEGLYGNPGGLHDEGQAAKKELEVARERVATVLGAHADEIFFTSGGTESNNLGIFGTLRALLHEHGELNAVTTPIEHPSVLEPLHMLEREGLYVTYVPVDERGIVEPKALRETVNEQTVFVSVQMVNSEIGTIQNIREFAKEVRHAKKERKSALPLYLHTDAPQAPLWQKLNVEKLGVDLMTLDAQKMMGPKSSGLLYARRGTTLEPIIFGGGQERGLRSGTENIVLAAGMAQALVDAQASVEKNIAVAKMSDYLWNEIKKNFPDAILYGAAVGDRVANNLCFSIPGLNGQMTVVALNTKGVAAATRSACAAADEEPSHVLLALGVDKKSAGEAVRITLLPSATRSDAHKIATALQSVAKRYRNVVN